MMDEATNQADPPLAACMAIAGVGLLGASLGLALKERKLCRRVIGIGRADSPSLAQAREIGAIDEGFTDPQAAAEAQIVVLATNVGLFPDLMRRMGPVLAPGTLVTDVGSTKVQVMRWAARYLPAAVDFIGSHPMAGSEKRGPLAAKPDLFNNAICLLCPPPARGRGRGTPARIHAAMTRTQSMWRNIGMQTRQLPPEAHDAWVAAISHLPHAAAMAVVLSAARTPDAFPAVAGGFLDTTRIAGGDAAMWADIFLTNRGPVRREIGNIIRELKQLQAAIAGNDRPKVLAMLEQAREMRGRIAAARAAAKLPAGDAPASSPAGAQGDL